ncbi:4 TMS phage holin, superfamily IV [Sanguibacter gelidistatuariae]|uniref:4 TMS phage holin, superfamily IV n=2 Tax=Sanguibacter gelidistatuariae TaxID=1814289 RepID=A0A1G6RRN6_9MICO|nr:4 TMS phage holin, superfamily IV [Sanguibacter gelidistatuariae]
MASAQVRSSIWGMVRFLIRAVIFLVSAALGLLVASWILDDVTVNATGFTVAVVIFAVAQSVLSPFIAKMTARNAPAFLGGIGLVSTYVALLIASLVSDGLEITGVQTWILATLIVWLVTALATLFLPMIFIRKKIDAKRKPTQIPPI